MARALPGMTPAAGSGGGGAATGLLARRSGTTKTKPEGEQVQVELGDGQTYTFTIPEGTSPSRSMASMIARMRAVDPDKADAVLKKVAGSIDDEDYDRYDLKKPNTDDKGLWGNVRHAAGSAVGGVLEVLDRTSQASLHSIQAAREAGDKGRDQGHSQTFDLAGGVLGAVGSSLLGHGERINTRQALGYNKDAGGLAGDIADFAGAAVLDPANYVSFGAGGLAKSAAKTAAEGLAKEGVRVGAKSLLRKGGVEAVGREGVERALRTAAEETGARGTRLQRIGRAAGLAGDKSAAEQVAARQLKALERRGAGGIVVGGRTILSGETLRKPLEAARILDRTQDVPLTRLFSTAAEGGRFTDDAADAVRGLDVTPDVAARARRAAEEAAGGAREAGPVGSTGPVARGAGEAATAAEDLSDVERGVLNREFVGYASDHGIRSLLNDNDIPAHFPFIDEADQPTELLTEEWDKLRPLVSEHKAMQEERLALAKAADAGEDLGDAASRVTRNADGDVMVDGYTTQRLQNAADDYGMWDSALSKMEPKVRAARGEAVPGAGAAAGAADEAAGMAGEAAGVAGEAAGAAGPGSNAFDLSEAIARGARPLEDLPPMPGSIKQAGGRTLQSMVQGSRPYEFAENVFKPRAGVARKYGQETADQIYRSAAKQRGVVTQGMNEAAAAVGKAIDGGQVTDAELMSWANALDGGDITAMRATLPPEKQTVFDQLRRMGTEDAGMLKDAGVNDEDVLNHVATRLVRMLTKPGEAALRRDRFAVGEMLGASGSEVEAGLNARRNLGPTLGFLGDDAVGTTEEAVGGALRDQGIAGRGFGAARQGRPLLETNAGVLALEGRNRTLQAISKSKQVQELAGTLVDENTGESLVHLLTPEEAAMASRADDAAKEVAAAEKRVAAAREARGKANAAKPGEAGARRASKANQRLQEAERQLADARSAAAEAGPPRPGVGPKPGWKKIDMGDPAMGEAWAPAEIADAISNTQAIFNNDVALKQFEHGLDSVNRVWKQMATSPIVGGVGFHSRNALGNVFNNYLAGVLPGSGAYREAAKMQRLVKKATLEAGTAPGGFERALREAGASERHIKLLGAARERGVLDDAFFTTDLAPDLAKAGRGAVGKGRKAGRKAAEVAKGQEMGRAIEGNARLAHFIAKTDELGSFDQAAMSVKKHLFDYADLTGAERRIFGRTMAFYTFAKNNTALQVATMLKNPRKYAWLPKAELLAQDPHAKDSDVLPDYATTAGQIPLNAGLRKVLGGDDTPLMGSLDLPVNAAMETVQPFTQMASLAPGPAGKATRAVLPRFLEADQEGSGIQQAFRNTVNLTSGVIPEVVKHIVEGATGKSLLTGAPLKEDAGLVRNAGQFAPIIPKIARLKEGVTGTGRAEGRDLKRETLVNALLGLNLTPVDDKATENQAWANREEVTAALDDLERIFGYVPTLDQLRELGLQAEAPDTSRHRRKRIGAASGAGGSFRRLPGS